MQEFLEALAVIACYLEANPYIRMHIRIRRFFLKQFLPPLVDGVKGLSLQRLLKISQAKLNRNNQPPS